MLSRSLALGLVMTAANTAGAFTLDFYCVSQNNIEDCAAGESQLYVEVSEATGGNVSFTFLNNGATNLSVSEVYFDDGTLLAIASIVDKDDGVGGHRGVDFTAGSATPPILPSGNSATPPFEVTAGFLADADNPPTKNAINPDEWLSIIFSLQSGQTLDDVEYQLASGDLRIGLHAIGYDSGGSESFINKPLTAVPLPAAFWLFLSGLSPLMWRARRSHRQL